MTFSKFWKIQVFRPPKNQVTVILTINKPLEHVDVVFPMVNGDFSPTFFTPKTFPLNVPKPNTWSNFATRCAACGSIMADFTEARIRGWFFRCFPAFFSGKKSAFRNRFFWVGNPFFLVNERQVFKVDDFPQIKKQVSLKTTSRGKVFDERSVDPSKPVRLFQQLVSLNLSPPLW